MFIRKCIPFNIICDMIEKDTNANFDHSAYNLKPKHRVLSTHPTVNDSLPNCILSGRIIIKRNIDRFVENGIIFEGEDQITEADAVILATGYHIKFPFIDSQIISTEDNKICLYRYTFPTNLKHSTLAVIGLIQPIGSIFNISEMQCRLFMQVFSGKVKLPSVEEMEKDIIRKNEANVKRYVASTRHTIQVEWIEFMDELADMIGAKPNFFKLAITDPKLFLACIFGPCLSYQYRIHGPNSWEGARDAILTCEERVYAPLNPNFKRTSQSSGKILNNKNILLILVISTAGLLYGREYLRQITARFSF